MIIIVQVQEKCTRNVQKTEESDDCSLVVNNEQFSTSAVQYAKLVDKNSTMDYEEMKSNIEKESSIIIGNDTEYDSDGLTCESDDQFEIAVLNNQLQLEMKKITI